VFSEALAPQLGGFLMLAGGLLVASAGLATSEPG
jgi:hypothetical protein